MSVPLAVALVAAALCFLGLGAAPYVDPPEGFHAEIAREMAATGDWLTPRLNGIRYFDKPPVPYWLMAAAFTVAGPTPAAARFWPAAAAVGCAALTAWLGTRLGGPRLGLLAGLMVVTNLGVFVYARIVKPDLLFVLAITAAWTGAALAWQRRDRRWLVLFYAALGVAAITKDILGALGPLMVLAVALVLAAERPVRAWFPWWGFAILAAVALPWYLAVEARNPGFLWYTVIDNHLLTATGRRAFPDEDVPLGTVEFLLVTGAGFLPWALAAPLGLARVLRRARAEATSRAWVPLAVWAIAVIAVFAVVPFKLPHYGLPAFPAWALLAAVAWDSALGDAPDAPRLKDLLVPVAVVFGAAALALGAVAAGFVGPPGSNLATVDVATRNLVARGAPVPSALAAAWTSVIVTSAVILGAAALLLAVAVWKRSVMLGVAVTFGAMVAFLPVAGQGIVRYASARAAAPVAAALAARLQPDDVVIHEGALENSGSILLGLGQTVRIVEGLRSNLAFGATFPEARDVFWDGERLRREWSRPGRRFLVSTVAPDRSVVQRLPPGHVHLIAAAGGRRVYANLADRPTAGR